MACLQMRSCTECGELFGPSCFEGTCAKCTKCIDCGKKGIAPLFGDRCATCGIRYINRYIREIDEAHLKTRNSKLRFGASSRANHGSKQCGAG